MLTAIFDMPMIAVFVFDSIDSRSVENGIDVEEIESVEDNFRHLLSGYGFSYSMVYILLFAASPD